MRERVGERERERERESGRWTLSEMSGEHNVLLCNHQSFVIRTESASY